MLALGYFADRNETDKRRFGGATADRVRVGRPQASISMSSHQALLSSYTVPSSIQCEDIQFLAPPHSQPSSEWFSVLPYSATATSAGGGHISMSHCVQGPQHSQMFKELPIRGNNGDGQFTDDISGIDPELIEDQGDASTDNPWSEMFRDESGP